MKLQKIFVIIFSFLSGLLLFSFLWWHYQLGSIRYFDADELAYLHWAHNVFSGRVPMIDFLMYVPPAFLYLLSLLYIISSGTAIFFTGRVMAWVIFVGICAALGFLFILVRGESEHGEFLGRWKNIWLFLLPGLFLLFLPLPFDKFIEIRPDNLSMLLSLIGLLCQIRLIKYEQKSMAFWSGVFYAVSLLILPKALLQAAIGVVILVCWALWGDTKMRQKRLILLRMFIFGLMLPFMAFGLWVLSVSHSVRDLDTIIYSLTKLPFEVNRLGEQFFMQPDLFFYPNSIYYGEGGVSSGLIANHLIWLVGLFVGIVRLMTPYIANGKSGVLVELLIAGSFILSIFSYVLWYPMRHAQYLIPVSVFVAYYGADAILMVWNKLRNSTWGAVLFAVVYIFGLGYLYEINLSVNIPKLSYNNSKNIVALTSALTIIPKDSYVLDLDGSTIYFKDPYYVSSVPFGQWEPYLSRPLPSLSQALERTNTKYIYDGQLGRIQTLSLKDQAYIADHFNKLPDSHIFIRKN